MRFHKRISMKTVRSNKNKFYGNFNNIMSVIGYNRNEIATLHLVKTYCVSTVIYGCETWYLDYNDYHRLDVMWNNSFRRIFGCCWRSRKCVMFSVLLSDFASVICGWSKYNSILEKALNCDNNITRTLAVNKWKLGLFLSKYLIPSINIDVSDIICRIFKHFVDMAHNSGKIQFC